MKSQVKSRKSKFEPDQILRIFLKKSKRSSRPLYEPELRSSTLNQHCKNELNSGIMWLIYIFIKKDGPTDTVVGAYVAHEYLEDYVSECAPRERQRREHALLEDGHPLTQHGSEGGKGDCLEQTHQKAD